MPLADKVNPVVGVGSKSLSEGERFLAIIIGVADESLLLLVSLHLLTANGGRHFGQVEDQELVLIVLILWDYFRFGSEPLPQFLGHWEAQVEEGPDVEDLPIV